MPNYLITLGQIYRELTHIRHFKSALNEPRQAQEKKLLEILQRNSSCEFGAKHGFGLIKNVSDYQTAVAPCKYEDLEPYIEKSMAGVPAQLSAEKPLMFATTSGTTGKPKFIPITKSHLSDYTHAFHVYNWGMTRDNIDVAHIPGARYLIFSSSDLDGNTADGTPIGSVSGLLRRKQSKLIQGFFAMPPAVGRIRNIEAKYYHILRLALNQNVVFMGSCNPSTLLILADQLNEHAEALIKDLYDGGVNRRFCLEEPLAREISPHYLADRQCAMRLEKILKKDGQLTPAAVWPQLSVISVWKGGPMQFYLDRLPEKFGNLKIRDFGYMASEGRGTIPLSDEGAGGVAALTSHFFEFVPEDEMTKSKRSFLLLDELQAGGRYYIHFTTASGLYRYNINDLMEVTGFEGRTPILKFVRKGGGISSITGEKLTEEQVTAAFQGAVHQLELSTIDHFVLAVQLDDTPFYCGYLESAVELSAGLLSLLAETIDSALQLQNVEYKDKRQSKRLGALQIRAVSRGTFLRLRQRRVLQGSPEAQVKIPFLTNNTSFCQYIDTLSDADSNADLNAELIMQA